MIVVICSSYQCGKSDANIVKRLLYVPHTRGSDLNLVFYVGYLVFFMDWDSYVIRPILPRVDQALFLLHGCFVIRLKSQGSLGIQWGSTTTHFLSFCGLLKSTKGAYTSVGQQPQYPKYLVVLKLGKFSFQKSFVLGNN